VLLEGAHADLPADDGLDPVHGGGQSRYRGDARDAAADRGGADLVAVEARAGLPGLPNGVFTIRSTSPASIRVTTVGSPSGPGPSPCFRTISVDLKSGDALVPEAHDCHPMDLPERQRHHR